MISIKKTNRKKIKMSEYAEHFIEMENNKHTHTPPTSFYMSKSDRAIKKLNLLPLNLKILKDLNEFEITNDPSIVEIYEFSVKINESDYLDIKEGIDVKDIENSIVNMMIEELKDKSIIIYSLVNNMSIIHEKGYDPKIVISSRIKIN